MNKQGADSDDGETSIQSENREEYNKDHNARRTKYQIIMLSLSFLSYCSVHMQREMWSISKPKIENDPKFDITDFDLSIVDTINFFVYGLT
jgi:sugar phosphate permease